MSSEDGMWNMARWNHLDTFFSACECAFEQFSRSRFGNFRGQKQRFKVDFDCRCCTPDVSRNHGRWADGTSLPRMLARGRVSVSVWVCVRARTRRDESVTGFTGASALHHGKGQPCCLLVCLQCCTGGLIWGVDRSCNLKRGHCSSEQKQLKENERRPLRVKNRKLSTCTLESAAPLAAHGAPCTSSPPSPAPTYWACIVMYDQICQFFL